MTQIDFSPVTQALDQLARLGFDARLWLRDDDAIARTPQLERLNDWAQNAAASALLAVIPAHADNSLAEFLSHSENLTPCVHGWAHANHAPGGEKSAEFGPHRAVDMMVAELARSKRHLGELLGESVVPVLVPPWNRMAQDLVAHLPQLGFSGLSAFGTSFIAPEPDNLRVANSHIDVIDWRGTRGCRDHDDLVTELAEHITTLGPAGHPIGILTHHLVHDDAVWHFLDDLSTMVNAHPAAHWVDARSIFS